MKTIYAANNDMNKIRKPFKLNKYIMNLSYFAKILCSTSKIKTSH